MTDPFRPRSAADLTDEPGIPHLIQDVCRPVGSILLYGRPGIGKTRFLWQIACGWAEGKAVFGLTPARPLKITFIEADMYRSDFESMIKEYRDNGLPPPPSLVWFSRDDDTAFNIAGSFGKAVRAWNEASDTDLTLYDAIPDICLGNPNDVQTAYDALRALAFAANNRAYFGVMTQRKGSNMQTGDEDEENIDNLLGSQTWARQASTVWQMTKVPSLVWVKHRLCPKPKPIILTVSPGGVFSLKGSNAQGLIAREAARGYSSIRELADRIAATPEYRNLPGAYKDRMLRENITNLIAKGAIAPPTSPEAQENRNIKV